MLPAQTSLVTPRIKRNCIQVEGTARAVVISCGDNTVMGRIASLASSLANDGTLNNYILNLFKRNMHIVYLHHFFGFFPTIQNGNKHKAAYSIFCAVYTEYVRRHFYVTTYT